VKRAGAVGLALALVAGPLAAQADTGLAAAFDLERRGLFAEAAARYEAALDRSPGSLQALLGLERALTPLDRMREMAPYLGPALAAGRSPAAYAVALRVWLAAGEPDSARRVVERWSQVDQDRLAPYREWGDLLLERRDPGSARRAYELGRHATGDSTAFAMELAQAATGTGDLVGAAPEWARTVGEYPGLRPAAVQALASAGSADRPAILRALDAMGEGGRSLAILLSAVWGDGAGAVRRLEQAPPSGPDAGTLIRELATVLSSRSAPADRRAFGRALELLADRSPGPRAASLRLEAARAYADGGDRAAARRLLAALGQDPSARAALGPNVSKVVIGALIAAGDLEEAGRELDAARDRLSADDAGDLRRQLALGWALAGDLDRAQRSVPPDSSVETAALQGLLFLYKGDLAGARQAFRWAGPYAGTRPEATRRTALLALLQPIAADTLAALGQGIWSLDRGDSAGAVAELTPLAASLPAAKGGAELTLLLGRIAEARGDTAGAERAFRAAASAQAPATAPAAAAELARYLLRRGRKGDAVAVLEHLILTWPTAAVVPEARRQLEAARNGGGGS
jgi:tetratricopeptide (TPR) repeat protein